MKENRTRSILQRLPVILAVTAASYGLPQAHAARPAAAKSANGAAAKVTPVQAAVSAMAVN